MHITILRDYDEKWDDSLYVAIWHNEATLYHGNPIAINMYSSKKKLLKLIADTDDIVTEMTWLIQNIEDLEKIELLEQDSEIRIKTKELTATMYATDELTNLIKNLSSNEIN